MGMFSVMYGYGCVISDKNIKKKTKMKIINDLLWEAQMVQTQIQRHLGKKPQKIQTRIPFQVPITCAKTKRKQSVQLIVG